MKKLFGVCVLLGILLSCNQNPITGRSQMQFFNEDDLQSMALQQYNDFIKTNKVVPAATDKNAEMVRRVGQRLTQSLTSYYTQQGLGSVLKGFNWEYNLVAAKEANAWCMPGGKIVVYTGLLAYTQQETALAIVMGHEIAHALARHGNERMSQATLQQLGGVALSVAIANKSQEAQDLMINAYGIGTTIGGTLPFSRKHELEADRLGVNYAAMAGYDPREAIALWERMAKAGEGKAPPELLSTHPAEATRIEKLKEIMPEALKYYRPNNQINK